MTCGPKNQEREGPERETGKLTSRTQAIFLALLKVRHGCEAAALHAVNATDPRTVSTTQQILLFHQEWCRVPARARFTIRQFFAVEDVFSVDFSKFRREGSIAASVVSVTKQTPSVFLAFGA